MATIFLEPKYSSIIFFIFVIIVLYVCAFVWFGYQMYLMITQIQIEKIQKAEAKAYSEARNKGSWSYDYTPSEYKQIFIENLEKNGFTKPLAMYMNTKSDEKLSVYPPKYEPTLVEPEVGGIKDLQLEFPKQPHYSIV